MVRFFIRWVFMMSLATPALAGDASSNAMSAPAPASGDSAATSIPSDPTSAPPDSAPPPIAHPTKAVCRVCDAKGSHHGKEDVVAWRTHEGVTYYFCSEDCASTFDANPNAYVEPRFPRPAPSAVVRTLDGEKIELETLRGDVTLIHFWTTWCEPCVKAMPKMQKLQKELGRRGFRTVGISIDEAGDLAVHELVEAQGITYSVVLDDEETPAWEAFLVVTVPSTYLVDREGQIVTQWSGQFDWKEIEGAVRKEISAVPR